MDAVGGECHDRTNQLELMMRKRKERNGIEVEEGKLEEEEEKKEEEEEES